MYAEVDIDEFVPNVCFKSPGRVQGVGRRVSGSHRRRAQDKSSHNLPEMGKMNARDSWSGDSVRQVGEQRHHNFQGCYLSPYY